MRKSKFSESHIASVLREVAAGTAVADVCRQHGISTATFFQWRSKYGGMRGVGSFTVGRSIAACAAQTAWRS